MDDDRIEFRDVILALLDNAITEAQAGHGRRIEIELEGGTLRISDDGRGLPVHEHPQSARSLTEVIFTGPRRGPRNTLARLNGACLWLEVEVQRDGGLWYQRFDYALPQAPLERRGVANQTGTRIACEPVAGEPPPFGDLVEYVQSLEDDDLAGPIEVVIRDASEDCEETVRLGDGS